MVENKVKGGNITRIDARGEDGLVGGNCRRRELRIGIVYTQWNEQVIHELVHGVMKSLYDCNALPLNPSSPPPPPPRHFIVQNLSNHIVVCIRI